jgi:nonribosomal peptide synthetase MxcG
MINANNLTVASSGVRNILLTGSSGFVGVHLLASILNHTDSRVLCLMLGGSTSEAFQRLASSLGRHQLVIDWSRVEILLGDLSKPRLGLEDSHYRELQQSLDLIMHAAADVSLFSKYEQLKEVNVDGVGQMLEMANGTRRIPLTHISSYSVFNEASYRQEQVVFEEPLPAREPVFRNGYAESKWRAERICNEANASGAPVKILRLPYILGAASSGTCNPQGYIELISKAMLLVSVAPDLDFNLTSLPVDICADLVVQVALGTPAQSGIFHLTPFAPFHWSAICEAASNYVHELELLPALEWYQHIKKCALTHRELFSGRGSSGKRSIPDAIPVEYPSPAL